MKAVGYGLLVLFFAMSIFQTAASFRDFQRPELKSERLFTMDRGSPLAAKAGQVMAAQRPRITHAR